MSSGPGSLRIGTSGWQYDDWRGVVYPDGLPRRAWFEHYATELFDTVELNATFYRLPAETTVRRWAAAAPAGFTYAVKLGAYCTHRRKLTAVEQWLPRHLERVRLLGGHLGPNLVQLPPRWHRDVARLDGFLAQAPADLRWTVELRDPTWIHEETFECLERHGAALCLHDMLPALPRRLTADWTYLRFHGPRAPEEPYAGRYPRPFLDDQAERLGGWLADGIDVYAYFDNDVAGAAVQDALALRGLLDGTVPPANGAAHGP